MTSPCRRAGRLLALTLLTAGLALGMTQPRAGAAVVPVSLTVSQKDLRIAPNVKLRAWTFNGSVPGPVVRATEGDVIQVTLKNADQGSPAKKVRRRVKVRVRDGRGRWVVRKRWKTVRIPGRPAQPHSIDFHAAEIAPEQNFKSIPPGQTHTFSFVANRAGVYLYHCGTPSMLEHMAMGMYGAIVVDPVTPRPPAAKEITIVQSEFYGTVKNGRLESSRHAMHTQMPAFLAFNGASDTYARNPIHVPVSGPSDPPVRINFVNAGPSNFSAFHVVGTIFDEYQPDGHTSELVRGVSTQTIAPGAGGVFEVRFAEPGMYPVVSHSMRDMEKGAMGMFHAE